jgi:hypothetical protein
MEDQAYPSFGQAVLLVVLVIALQTGLAGILSAFAGGMPSPRIQSSLIGVANLGAFGGVIWLARKRSNYDLEARFVHLPVDWQLALAVVLTAAGAQIVLSEIDNVVRTVLPPPEWLESAFVDLLGAEGLFASIVLLVAVAPLTEEPLFRGIILHGFRRRYSPLRACVLSSLLFAAVHLNPWQFIGAFAVGLYLSYLALRTRSLALPMIVHALHNALPLLMVFVFRAEIRGFTTGLGSEPVFQPLWFDLLGLGLLAAGLYLTYERLSANGVESAEQPSDEEPEGWEESDDE